MAQGPARILVLEGDGIGPEIVAVTLDVVREADRLFELGLEFEHQDIGFAALRKYGTTYPDGVLEAAKRCSGIIIGPVSRSEYPPLSEGGANPSGNLRKQLDLFANIRPSRSRPGVPQPCGKPIDLVIVRENTEGFYADRSMFLGPGEFMPTPDVALSIRKVTRTGSMRIAEIAFPMAMRRRKKVTVVVKRNVLRVTDGLFRECASSVAARFPEVEYEEKNIDAMTALLIRDPGAFDVILTTNMYGDILSDEAAELSGSLGMGGSLNAAENHAFAQAQHGSAPDIAGKDLANPTSLISSAAMLLAWIGERRGEEKFFAASNAIETALDAAFGRPGCRTRDLGGELGTKAFGAQVVSSLSAVARRGAA